MVKIMENPYEQMDDLGVPLKHLLLGCSRKLVDG